MSLQTILRIDFTRTIQTFGVGMIDKTYYMFLTNKHLFD